jgi:SAM-dependent methyltransferase
LRSDPSTKLLDVACCAGQVLRALHVLQDVPPSQLAGTDLKSEFIEAGFELWRDKGGKFGEEAQFVAGDLLADDDEGLRVLDGRFVLVHAGNFFHLFDWSTQVRAASRIVRFLAAPPPRPPPPPPPPASSPGGAEDATPPSSPAIVFGRQLGSLSPGERTVQSAAARRRTGTRFLHDGGSFQKLWDEVGEKTGTRWTVHVEVLTDKLPPKMPSFGEDTRLVRFAAVRVEE